MADLFQKIIDYEDGQLELEQIIELFQEIIDTGLVWQLQGHYGRTAKDLIEQGYCHFAKEVA